MSQKLSLDSLLKKEQLRAMLGARPVLTFEEAGLFLDVKPSTFYLICRKKRGPKAYKIGKRWHVNTADLNAWLTSNSNKTLVG